MNEPQKSLRLLRAELASIDLSDIPRREKTEAEREEYVTAISVVFPRLEEDIKDFMHKQLMFVYIYVEVAIFFVKITKKRLAISPVNVYKRKANKLNMGNKMTAHIIGDKNSTKVVIASGLS